MSLVGFSASNHPQQTARSGAKDTVDERITPQDLFDKYNASYGFTLDVAANKSNAKCPAYFDLDSNGLAQEWTGSVWCNPPYSDIRPWVEKAIASVASKSARVVVLLLPANRTEQRWWQDLVEPIRDDGRGGPVNISTEFLARRLNFGTPSNPTGKYKSSAPFGCVVLVVRPV